MYDSVDLRKILRMKLAKYAFFRDETSIFSKKGPFCKALLGPKREPFVRQNFKCGPLCKVIFRETIPVKWNILVYRVQGEPPPFPGSRVVSQLIQLFMFQFPACHFLIYYQGAYMIFQITSTHNYKRMVLQSFDFDCHFSKSKDLLTQLVSVVSMFQFRACYFLTITMVPTYFKLILHTLTLQQGGFAKF